MSPVWERQPKESGKAFEALCVYLEMGPDRTLRAVARKLGKCDSQIKKWSTDWEWQARASAYQDHHSRLRQKAMEAATIAEANEWHKREEEMRLSQYNQAKRWIAKVDKLMEMPHARITSDTVEEDGKTIHRTIVNPVTCSLEGISKISERAHRQALEASRHEGCGWELGERRDEIWNVIDYEPKT